MILNLFNFVLYVFKSIIGFNKGQTISFVK